MSILRLCTGAVQVDCLFRPHYVTWSEQQLIKQHTARCLRNIVRIITETGLRIRKELLAGPGDWLFPSSESKSGHLETVNKARRKTLEKAGITYFRIYDLRSTFGTRLSAGRVSDEWVAQMLRKEMRRSSRSTRG